MLILVLFLLLVHSRYDANREYTSRNDVDSEYTSHKDAGDGYIFRNDAGNEHAFRNGAGNENAFRSRYSKYPFYEESDGVMLLNVLHKNQPLTIFDTELRKINLPAMLSELSKEMLENQVFDLKYENYQNKIWLELKKEPLVKTGGSNRSFQGKRTETPPFLHLKKIVGTTRFQLISRDECLTVGEEITYRGIPAWTLSFMPCEDRRDDQIFAMIPSLKATIKLNPETKSLKMAGKMRFTFERIEKIINTVDLRQIRN